MATQFPQHAVSIVIDRGTEHPRLDFPSIRNYWFSGKAFTGGIEEHTIENTTIHVYSAAKKLAEFFKYPNQIGIDTVGYARGATDVRLHATVVVERP